MSRISAASYTFAGDAPKPSHPYAPKKGDRFLRGPIPLPWLQLATQQGGSAASVGIILWYLVGLSKGLKVKFNQSKYSGWGLERDAARRGLEKLESAGLVTVTRGRGRAPIVQIHKDVGYVEIKTADVP